MAKAKKVIASWKLQTMFAQELKTRLNKGIVKDRTAFQLHGYYTAKLCVPMIGKCYLIVKMHEGILEKLTHNAHYRDFDFDSWEPLKRDKYLSPTHGNAKKLNKLVEKLETFRFMLHQELAYLNVTAANVIADMKISQYEIVDEAPKERKSSCLAVQRDILNDVDDRQIEFQNQNRAHEPDNFR